MRSLCSFTIVLLVLHLFPGLESCHIALGQSRPWQPSLRLVDESGNEVDGKVAVLSIADRLKPGEQSFYVSKYEYKALSEVERNQGRWEPVGKESSFLIQAPSGMLDIVYTLDRYDHLVKDQGPTALTFLDSDRKPIKNASLALTGLSNSPITQNCIPEPWQDRYQFKCDDDGRFLVPQMRPGFYFYFDLRLEGDRCYRFVHYQPESSQAGDLLLALPLISSLRGKVVHDQKLEGDWYARLFLEGHPFSHFYLPPEPVAKVQEDGSFAFDNVPNQHYSIHFENRGKEQPTYPLPIPSFSFQAREPEVRITVAVRAVKLVGGIVNSQRLPIENKCSLVLDWKHEARPQQNGRFEIVVPHHPTTLHPLIENGTAESVSLNMPPTQDMSRIDIDDIVAEVTDQPFQVVAGKSLRPILKADPSNQFGIHVGNSGIAFDREGRGHFYSEKTLSESKIELVSSNRSLELVASKVDGVWILELTPEAQSSRESGILVVDQFGKPLANEKLEVTAYHRTGVSSSWLQSNSEGRVEISNLETDEYTGELRISAMKAPLGFDRKKFEARIEVPIPEVGPLPTVTIFQLQTMEFRGTLVDEKGMPVRLRSAWFCQQLQLPHHFRTDENGEFSVHGESGKGFLFLEEPYAVCQIELQENVPIIASLKDNLLDARKKVAEPQFPRKEVSFERRKEIAKELIEGLEADQVRNYASLATRYGIRPFCSLDESYALLERNDDKEARSQAAWLLSSWWAPQEELVVRKFESFCPSEKIAANLLLNAAQNFPDPVIKRKLLNDAWKHVEKSQNAGSIAILVALHLFWLEDYDKFSLASDMYYETKTAISLGDYKPEYQEAFDSFLTQVIDDAQRPWREIQDAIYDRNHVGMMVNGRSRGASVLALLLADPVVFNGELESPEFQRIIFHEYSFPDWSLHQILRRMIQVAPESTWKLYLQERSSAINSNWTPPLANIQWEFLKLNFHAEDIAREIFTEQHQILNTFAQGDWRRPTYVQNLTLLSNRFPDFASEADWLISFLLFKPIVPGFSQDAAEGNALSQQIHALRYLDANQPRLVQAFNIHPEQLLEKRLAENANLAGNANSHRELAKEVAIYFPDALHKLCADRTPQGQKQNRSIGWLGNLRDDLISVVFTGLLDAK